jgi:diadenosine tetraphosphatase ApaH/serine/threonine PP2A family protein phosphatase
LRYGIVSDIHSNFEALEACIRHLESKDVDAYLSTGDIVGYGADPKRCLDRIRELGTIVVAGNHDWAVSSRLSLDYFNAYAREAIYWTQERLAESDIRYLDELDLKRIVDDITLVHGTLYNPENFDYLLTSYDAHLSFQMQETPLCLVGHSHVPITFLLDGTVTFTLDTEIDLSGVERAVVNPGSVGQPRDENPKASVGIFDTETRVFTTDRVDYDIEAATAKILRAGLPEVPAERLWHGR